MKALTTEVECKPCDTIYLRNFFLRSNCSQNFKRNSIYYVSENLFLLLYKRTYNIVLSHDFPFSLLRNFQFLICRRFRCVKVRGEGDEQVSDENLQEIPRTNPARNLVDRNEHARDKPASKASLLEDAARHRHFIRPH